MALVPSSEPNLYEGLGVGFRVPVAPDHAWAPDRDLARPARHQEADEHERTNRSGCLATTSRFEGARARTAWCMVGTAVYRVGRKASSHSKNLGPRKPGPQTTLAPAASEASTPPTRS